MTEPILIQAIRESLERHLEELVVNQEYDYYIPDNDDLSSIILLDIINRFGSPGNDDFHRHMKEHRKNQIKSLGKYKKIKNSDIFEDKCSICIDTFKVGEFHRKLSCNHCFHKKCIDSWFKKKNECPLCRAVIIKS
jgi:hypothetical protein